MAVKKKKTAPAEQARSTIAPSGADAIAVGTAAGAMMLGVAHADAAKAEQALQTIAATRPAEKAEEADPAAYTDGVADQLAGSSGQTITPDQHARANAPSEPAVEENGAAAPAVAAPLAPDTVTAASSEPADGAATVGVSEAPPTDAAGEPAATPPAAATTSAPALAATDAAVPASISAPPAIDTSALASRIADQISSAIDQISSGVAGGASTAALAESIAGDIAATVSGIATDIAATLPKPAELAQTITAQVDGILDASPVRTADVATDIAGSLPEPAELAQTITATVDGILDASPVGAMPDIAIPEVGELAKTITAQVDGVLDASPVARIADIATDIAVPTVAETADKVASPDAFQMLETLPSTLLGAESADAAPGGPLTEIFYSDGDSATAATAPPAASAPIDLAGTISDAASTLIVDIAPISIDFAGLSYADTPDMPSGGFAGSSLNALHLG